jgi:hypothetical protein
MVAMGNKRASQIWEYHLPAGFQRPAEHDSRFVLFLVYDDPSLTVLRCRGAESFIKSKYMMAQWKRKPTDPELPASTASEATDAVRPDDAVAASEKDEKRSHRHSRDRSERDSRREERVCGNSALLSFCV